MTIDMGANLASCPLVGYDRLGLLGVQLDYWSRVALENPALRLTHEPASLAERLSALSDQARRWTDAGAQGLGDGAVDALNDAGSALGFKRSRKPVRRRVDTIVIWGPTAAEVIQGAHKCVQLMENNLVVSPSVVVLTAARLGELDGSNGIISQLAALFGVVEPHQSLGSEVGLTEVGHSQRLGEVTLAALAVGPVDSSEPVDYRSALACYLNTGPIVPGSAFIVITPQQLSPTVHLSTVMDLALALDVEVETVGWASPNLENNELGALATVMADAFAVAGELAERHIGCAVVGAGATEAK